MALRQTRKWHVHISLQHHKDKYELVMLTEMLVQFQWIIFYVSNEVKNILLFGLVLSTGLTGHVDII